MKHLKSYGFWGLCVLFLIWGCWLLLPQKIADQSDPARTAQPPLSAQAAASPISEPATAPTPLSAQGTAMPPNPAALQGAPVRQDFFQTRPEEPAFAGFADWTRRYLEAAGPSAKATLEPEGTAWAQKRQAALYSMIQTDPERALQLAVPLGIRQQLPPAVEALLEERVSGRGDFGVLGVYPLPGQEREVKPIYRVTTIGDVEYQTFVYGRRADHPTHPDLPLDGIALKDGENRVLALSDHPVRLLEDVELAQIKQPTLGETLCPWDDKPITASDAPIAVAVGGEMMWLCSQAHAETLNEHLLADAGQPGVGSGGSTAESPYTEGRKRFVFFRVAFTDVPTPQLTDFRGKEIITNMSDWLIRVSYGHTSAAMPGEGSDVVLVNLPHEAAYYDDRAGPLQDDTRAAAAASGVDLSQYDFDVTATGNVPAFSWAGLGWVGGPGFWIRSGGSFSVSVTVHELGHNLGLLHGNYWDTGGESALGPGSNVEYGDIFDNMGGGGTTGDYCSKYKTYLGWIPSADYPLITASGLYRVFCQDHPDSRGTRGLRIVHNSDQELSLEFRQRFTGNPWLMNGLGLRWGNRSGRPTSQLIDTTPGTTSGRDDSAIVIGRTFTDSEAGVHITPVGKGHTYPESIDVVVRFGTPPGNQEPQVVVRTDFTETEPGRPLTFTASASDPNGDDLVYHWDFGDNTFGENSPVVSHSWTSARDYVVRCTVSDMHGGTASDSVLVKIGTSSTYYISGRVFQNDLPLEGVLVKASSSRYDYTASDGTYTITGLSAGNYTVTANRFPLSFANPWFSNPVTVGPTSADNINFLAANLPVDDVSVVAENAVWRYLDNGTDPGIAWRAPTFDDSGWASGPAELGYGDGDEATVVSYGPDANNKYITTYFRHAFNLDNLSAITNLSLTLLRDDGAVVYLNGVELLRDNMPAGTITASTLASENSEATVRTDIPFNLLVPGRNVLAAEVHQDAPTSSDISFSASVVATSITNLQDLTLVYISSPSDNAVIVKPIVLPIAVGAYSTSSTFTNVEFFANGTKIGQDSSEPFSMLWFRPALDTYTLTIQARDNHGAVFTAPPVTFELVETGASPPGNETLIAEGSTWKYLDDGSNQGASWTDPTFNDLSWSSGPAELGYGDGDEATVVGYGPDANNKFITTYFRHSFTVNDIATISSLNGRLKRDDGGVVFLNGSEVFRSNMPDGTIDYRTLASGAIGNEDEFTGFVIDPALLVPGSNVMAVEIHQNAVNSSDISFDFALEAQLAPPPPRGVVLTSPPDGAVLPAATTVSLTASATASNGLSITSVTFYAGESLIGTDNTFPYTFAWENPPIGSSILTAQATESGGIILTSSPVHVTVAHPSVPTSLISAGTSWKYLDTGVTPTPNWNALGFDDSRWPSGSARLGYGGDGEITTVSYGPDPNSKHIATWFRKAFSVSDPAAIDALRLRWQRDDGLLLYLNGVEILRDNLQAGLVSPNSLALQAVGGGDETAFFEATLEPALLRTGDNVIAAEVHQQSITSSDLGFDLELTALSETNLSEGIYLVSPAQNARFQTPAALRLEAYAVSGVGITQVEFFANGSSLGQVTSPPYALTWDNPPVDTYTLTAQATRTSGPALTSAPVAITVGPAPPPILPVATDIVATGSSWKYLDTGADLGTSWRERDFDDGDWPAGPARLGFGFDGEATTVNGGVATTYFRRWFEVPNPEWLDALVLRLQKDDGAVVYLNGLEVYRSNMPQGIPTASTLASSTLNGLEEQLFEQTILPTAGSGLVSGTNLLAVEVHQSSVTSSDLGFDLELSGLGSTDRRVYLSAPTAGAAFEVTSSILLEAQAWAGSGRSVDSVAFYANDIPLGEVATPPYQFAWTNATVGTYTLTAVATDDQSQTIPSAPVQVAVGFSQVLAQFIPPGAVWKYLDDGSNQGTAWTQPDYVDTGWASGPARLGYGNDGEVTTVSYGPNASSKYITTYFRRVFQAPVDSQFTNLTIRLQRDDGVVVWLNGTEVFRDNMPTGTISSSTLATSAVGGADEQNWFVAEIPVSGLPSGSNVLAVEVHQATLDSSDLGFDLELIGSGFQANLPPPPLTIRPFSSNRLYIAWPESAIGYELQSSPSLGDESSWNHVAITPAVSNANFYIIWFRFISPQQFFRLKKP